MSVVNNTVSCSVTRGLGGDVKYMLQATFLVLTQSFKIMPSLFPPLKEFKDENKTDVCTSKLKSVCSVPTCLQSKWQSIQWH